MSIFGKITHFLNKLDRYDPLDKLVKRGFKSILNLLKPTIPKQGTPGAQVYAGSLQNNAAQIGEAQTVIFGLVRAWPQLRTQIWFEYIGNDQVIHAWMRLSVGFAQILDALIGKTPLLSFADSRVDVLLPGTPMVQFHPNVYTNPQSNGVEFAAGALANRIVTHSFTFAPSGHPQRIDAGTSVFDNDITIGSTVIVAGTTSNNGTKTVTAYDTGGGSPNWIEVAETVVAETANATIDYGVYDDNDESIKRVNNVGLVFDAASSTVTVTVDLNEQDHDANVFIINDQIVFKSAGVNSDIAFTILDLLQDAIGNAVYVLSPAPTSATVTPDPSSPTNTRNTPNILLLRRFQGPFAVCPPGDMVDMVAFDYEFDQGLGNSQNSGAIDDFTVIVDEQWQQIDDYGNPMTDWASFGLRSITASTRTPVRRSFPVVVESPCRMWVRFARVSNAGGGSDHLNHMNLMGARGFVRQIPGDDNVYAVDMDSTTVVVTVRFNGILASLQDLNFNCLTQGMKEIYDPETQTWSAPQATRSPVWADLDAMRGPFTARGVQIPNSQLDLVNMAARAAVLDAAGVYFDGAFASFSTLLDARQTVLRVCRAAPYLDWLRGVHAQFFDEKRAAVQMFTDLNSSNTTYQGTLQNENANTGVLTSYQDPVLWEEKTVGDADTDTKPAKIDLRNGITARQQAWANSAFYEWQKQLYRVRPGSTNTELEAVNAKFGDPILMQSAECGWGQGCQLVSSVGRTFVVWPALKWTDGVQAFVYLGAPNGAPGSKINCARGSGDNVLILASDPDVELTGDGNMEQRTLIAFGIPGNEPQFALQQATTPSVGSNSGTQCKVEFILDDDRVYADPGMAPPDPYPSVAVTDASLTITSFALSFAGAVGTLTWDALTSVEQYVIEWDHDGSIDWKLVGRPQGTATSASFTVDEAGVINARIFGRGKRGNVGPYSYAQAVASTGSGGASGLTVSLSRASANRNTTDGSDTQTAPVTATITGGTPPYTGVWTKVSGGAIAADTPNDVTTTFSATSLLARGEIRTAIFKYTATDSAVHSADSANLPVAMKNNYNGGPMP